MEKEIIDFVKNELKDEHSGHDFEHIKRTVNNALKLMEKEGGDERIIIPACYLHDCADVKLFDDIESQINKIKNLLCKYYNDSEISEIIDIITSISFNNNNYKNLSTLNAMIVRDADRLDAIGSIGIIRTIEYGNSLRRKFYEDDNLKECDGKIVFNKSTKTTLSHFYDKLLKLGDLMHTLTGKKMAEDRLEVMKYFLDSFYKELGSRD